MKHRRSDSRLFRGRTLDVSLRADPRNGLHPMAAKFGEGVEIPLSSKVWVSPYSLDQGREGACVGFAGAHFFGSEARIQDVTTRTARRFYKGAQRHDSWPGEDYEGTSVNGLIDYFKSQNLVGEYNWIFNFDELQRTIALYGPVIVGCEWREGCFEPDAQGFITFTGASKGGHATCWRGINFEEQYILIQQSWGRGHGQNGIVKMHFADVALLLRTRPQICFPEKKALQSLTKPRRWWQFWK